ncbi:MAG TPA: HEPN domain-containing protein, partial [Xanthobacteraceae bacterium]
NSYTIDRLIGAANAFDLLPNTTFRKPKIPKGVLKGLAALTRDAKQLKPPYGEQVLSNLHRVKSLNLRQKIKSRYQLLPPNIRDLLPEMELLIEHCVRSRNYFVHGAKPKLSDDSTRDLMVPLTDTLEFIFVASEIFECGWKPERWMKEASRGKLRDFVRFYDETLQRVKNGLKAATATNNLN